MMMTPERLIFLQEYVAKIAARGRVVGRQALKIKFLKGPRETHRGREARLHPLSQASTGSPSPKDDV